MRIRIGNSRLPCYAVAMTKTMRLIGIGVALGLGLLGTRMLRAQSPGSPTAAAGSIKVISLEDFDRLRKDKKHLVLDVRSGSEYAGGHVPGATNLNVSAPDFRERVGGIAKSTPILVYCASGARSARATALMQQWGFKDLSDFGGGWYQWKKSGKPVAK